MDRWAGKCAVVTGASAGIGAAIALALADAGMTVVGAARRLDKLQVSLSVQDLQKKVKGSGRLLCCRCDVSKELDVCAMMNFAKQEGGGIDVLVNNAAVLPTGTVTDCKGNGTALATIDEAFDVNIKAVVKASRMAAEDMTSRKVAGHIIIINSISGHKIVNLGSVPAISVYAPTKYALTALAETIRLEFSFTDSPIRITSVSPGAVDTAMLHSIPNIPQEIPQLKPEDVASAVIYALSVPQSVNITELTIQPTGEKF